jgi:hypothetical protein
MELDAERVQILSRLKDIDKEISEQEVAIRVIRNVMGTANYTAPATNHSVGTVTDSVTTSIIHRSPAFEGDPPSQLPIKDVILEVLRGAYPNVMNASEIREAALADFKVNVNPNTLTVALGRWKAKKRVVIEGRDWSYMPSALEVMESHVKRAVEAVSEAASTALATDHAMKRGEVVHDKMS